MNNIIYLNDRRKQSRQEFIDLWAMDVVRDIEELLMLSELGYLGKQNSSQDANKKCMQWGKQTGKFKVYDGGKK